MGESLSALIQWLDRDFWKTGAFLSSFDGETITLGKGGSTQRVSRFLTTSKPIFYLKDFYKNAYLAYSPATVLECTKAELEEYFKTLPKETHPSHLATGNDDDLYQKDFISLKEALGQKLEKVVLISREIYDDLEEEETLKRLFHKAFTFGTGIPYGLWGEDYGVIGSTPELLYDIDMDLLRTFALAGTAKEGQEKELLKSKKDRHEHNLVIQDIKEKLKHFSDEIDVMETKIHHYKNIVHLKTDIEATIDEEIDLTALTNILSPTAALGGYPKESSLDFLQKSHYSRKYPDRYFGSCFGLVSPDVKEFIVSIRNVQWKDKKIFIESGGGIVNESEYEKELEEIYLKRQTIKKHYL